MVKTFRNKSIKSLFETGSERGLRPEHIKRLRMILVRLNNAQAIVDIDIPALKLHKLKGEYKDFWSVTVSGNWRVIFRFDGKDVFDIDYLDYH